MNEDYLGFAHLDQNIITTSWTTDKAISTQEAEVLFTMVFTSLEQGSVSNAVRINSSINSS